MLPVADAFLTAQRQEQVQIKAVAGTSAGAICAALVAANADFSKVRSFLRDQGPVWVSRLIPPEVQPLVGRTTDLAWWEWFAHRKLLQKVLWDGNPVLNTQALSQFFQELFKASSGGNGKRIEDCRSKLTIIASNIAASQAVIHQKGELVPALVDSCALPIILRSFNSLSSTHYVDGGLCDNLPVEGLLTDTEAPVFAVYPVSLGDESVRKNNLVTYILALLSASINHGALRSQAMISEPFRFEQETDLSLLEFQRAVDLIADDDWYERRKEDALARIRDFLNSYGVINTPSAARVVDVVDLSQYQKALMELSHDFDHQFEFELSRFMVRVNCSRVFSNQDDAIRREADTVTRTIRIKLLVDNVRFYRSNLTMADGSIVPTIWSVTNLTTKKDVPIRALALEERLHNNKNFKHCLIQFMDPGKHLNKGDVLEIQGIYPSARNNDLSQLNFKQGDFFGFTNASNPMMARAELILIYPRALGHLQMLSHPKRSTRRDEQQMTFSDEYRLALGEKFNVVGIWVSDVKPQESLFGQVVRVD